jgi:hypothetical protein
MTDFLSNQISIDQVPDPHASQLGDNKPDLTQQP